MIKSDLLQKNRFYRVPRIHADLVFQVFLRDQVLLEHILVEVVRRADAPLHTAAGHLNKMQSNSARHKNSEGEDG